MADIAILVAEEYERRVKNPRKEGLDAGKKELDLVSGLSISANRLKQMTGEANAEMFKWVCYPKSQIGRAAASGFFSA